MKELGSIKFEGDQFKNNKQFMIFKKFNKQFLKSVKNNQISSLLYEEKEVDEELIGTWYDTENSIIEPIPEPTPEPEPITAEPIPEPVEMKQVSRIHAQELFRTVRDQKPYKSFDLSSKLINILLEDDIKNIDEIFAENTESPATYKQTRALNNIIFGRHYTAKTFKELMRVLN